jgi:hypothetical protein
MLGAPGLKHPSTRRVPGPGEGLRPRSPTHCGGFPAPTGTGAPEAPLWGWGRRGVDAALIYGDFAGFGFAAGFLAQEEFEDCGLADAPGVGQFGHQPAALGREAEGDGLPVGNAHVTP